MKLTRGKLLKQSDWSDWQESEYLQLNQYFDQVMFGSPQLVNEDTAVFHLVWTYDIKALDGRKKARCICDGSPRAGQSRILDKTYANCVDQTSSCMFYAIAAAENLLIYGANVSNAFAEAPPPKQGFRTVPSMSGGPTISNNRHSIQVRLSPSYQRCRVIPNPRVYGRNMPTLYSGILDSPLLFTSRVFILE
jgi:hypothetical protein